MSAHRIKAGIFGTDHRHALLRGEPTDLPVDQAKVVRVFISSTFTDMSMERDALLDKAYPEVQEFCQKLGLVFEVVDMRWGVPNTLTADHMSTELCLTEIESCKRMSLGPTFVALLGNRYGFRPIPRVIEGKEFEELLLKHASDSQSLKLLQEWFWKDENAVPPVYILQPITTHLPDYSKMRTERREEHEKALQSWSDLQQRIADLLRVAATQAEKEGRIQKGARHKYFKSVTEFEIDRGLVETREGDVCSTVFIRDISNIWDHFDQQQLPKFIDVKDDGSIDTEAQERLASLKAQVVGKSARSLRMHWVQWSDGVLDTQSQAHAEYLHDLCQSFVEDMKQQIEGKVAARHGVREEPAWLFEELRHQGHLCRVKRSIFCGRSQLLANIGQCLEQHDGSTHWPLVIHGASGTGKTAVMSKLAEEVRKTFRNGCVVVTRLLGTSALSSEIHSVLKSVCFQVCLAFRLKVPAAHVTNSYTELVRFFHNLLSTASKKNRETLVLIFDSLDQLSSSDGAHRLHWLPKVCPPKVHIIVSTLPAEHNILAVLQEVIPRPECHFEVEPLSSQHGQELIDLLLRTVKRRLTTEQRDLILERFRDCGQPLMLKLTFDEAKRWNSYVPASELDVAAGTRDAVRLFYSHLEKTHGRVFVSHALGYIVCSRNGLSESELKEILSLDNEVLGDIYQYWSPPNKDIIRLPPLLWTRLRYDIGDYLVERQADGFPVLGLYHRQFTEVVHELYLLAEEKIKQHSVLADYFKGTWSHGNRKSITLPLLKETLVADRKVSAQPLRFGDDVLNLRKLSELPHHLLNGGRIEELKQDVLGNMEWIVCKVQASGMKGLLEDFYACTKQVDCPEVQLVQDALLLIWPTVDFMENGIDQSVLYTEMLARLHFFKGSYPMIDKLCQQCERWCAACPNPIFTPLCGFFQPPGGPLRTTLTGFSKGVTAMELSTDCTLLVAASLDGMMIVWNLQDIEVIHTLTGHSAEVKCIKVIHNKAQAVSGSFDHTLRLWNLLTGKEIYSIPEDHSGYEHFALLHVDEATDVIYSVSGPQIKAWHLKNGQPLFQLSGGTLDHTTCTAVLGSHSSLLTMSFGGTLCVWDEIQGTLQNTYHLTGLSLSTPTCILSIRSQDKVAVGFNDGFVAMVSLNGSCDTARVNCPITFLLASKDEKCLLAGFGKYIRVFKLDCSSILKVLLMDLEHSGSVQAAVISQDGSTLITGSNDETIRVWSLLDKGKLVDSMEGMGVPITLLSLSGNTLISASRSAYYLKIWSLAYNRQHKTIAPFHNRTAIAGISEDGKFVCFPKSGDLEKTVIWNPEEGVTLRTIDTGNEICRLAVVQLKRLLLCGLRSGALLAFCMETWQKLMCCQPPGPGETVQCLAVSRSEEQLATAYISCVMVRALHSAECDPLLGDTLATFPTLPRFVLTSMAVMSDCSVLLGMDTGELHLYTGNSLPTVLEPHDSRVTCLEISHKEQYAFSGCQGPVQRIWNLQKQRWDCEFSYKGLFFQGVKCAAFSLDDRIIYTGSRDRTIKAWDLRNGCLLVVQYVYAEVTNIVPSSTGLLASTRLGYLVRESFTCPAVPDANYNPLRNIRASCCAQVRHGQGTRRVYTTGPRNGSGKSPGKGQTRGFLQNSRPSALCCLL
ncbi:NACHT domain- and WD repeat-containing protein 1 [Chiloscyllium punctatum]|uniref:NACHT domain- and WD repeat-containing protein 1 n=1 Tax=Chiloscyllium punctatum TaxID=137246 RepID=UPI003B63E918